MPVIDTRLAEIQVLQKKVLETRNSDPDLAVQMSRQMEGLQRTLSRDLEPIYALMAKTQFRS